MPTFGLPENAPNIATTACVRSLELLYLRTSSPRRPCNTRTTRDPMIDVQSTSFEKLCDWRF